MPTVFVANLALLLPETLAAGEIIDETLAQFLNEIKLQRIRTRIKRLLSRAEISPAEVQSKAQEFASLQLTPYLTLDDEEENLDPVLEEALTMAKSLIIARMTKENLPPPKGIDDHARALVDAMPQIQERARLRVEARYKTAALAIEGIM